MLLDFLVIPQHAHGIGSRLSEAFDLFFANLAMMLHVKFGL